MEKLLSRRALRMGHPGLCALELRPPPVPERPACVRPPASGLCPGSPAPISQPTGAPLSSPSFQIHLLPGRHQCCARRGCSMVERTDGWMVLSLANVTLPSPSKPKNCLLLHLPTPTSRPVPITFSGTSPPPSGRGEPRSGCRGPCCWSSPVPDPTRQRGAGFRGNRLPLKIFNDLG